MYIQHKRSQVVACATVSYYARQVLLDVKCAMPVSAVTSTQTLKWRQYKQTPFLSIFKATMSTVLCHFYRAMLCIRSTSVGIQVYNFICPLNFPKFAYKGLVWNSLRGFRLSI